MGFLRWISSNTRALGLFRRQFLTKSFFVLSGALLVVSAGFVQFLGCKISTKKNIWLVPLRKKKRLGWWIKQWDYSRYQAWGFTEPHPKTETRLTETEAAAATIHDNAFPALVLQPLSAFCPWQKARRTSRRSSRSTSHSLLAAAPWLSSTLEW